MADVADLFAKFVDKLFFVCQHSVMQLADRFYTSTEVAEILSVSLRSVYRYLEEDKLKAEVKTATGRHRFTRQNIIDFLYPQGGILEEGAVEGTTSGSVSVSAQDTPAQTSQVSEPAASVDWLSKFKAAAAKNRSDLGELSQATSVDSSGAPAVVEGSQDAPVSQEAPADVPVEATPQVTPEIPIAPVAPAKTPVQTIPVQPVESALPASAVAAQPAAKAATQGQPVASVPVSIPANNTEFLSSLTTPAPAPAPAPAPTPAPAPAAVAEQPSSTQVSSGDVLHYKSNVGGLKELAQYISKVAAKSKVPYAFTMNAGMSIHKLIRPFSLLHAYISIEDREFFEKALELTPSDESSAQLCLFVTKNKSIFENAKEVHGLSIVADLQLKQDLLNNGEVDLAKELEEVLQ